MITLKTNDEYSEAEENPPRELLILHYNDVYSISARKSDPVGGPTRFAAAIDAFRDMHPYVVFSGDALNPSIISTVTQGQHMPDVLNALDTNVATVGNHDLDFGVDNLRAAIKKCAFPWVLSNVTETATGAVLGGEDLVLTSHMVQWPSMHGNGSIAVGVMGLAEEDWLSCISAVPRSALQYTDFVQCANATAAKLRGDGAEVIIAITHFRLPNDQRLAVEALDVDVILGGHDHMYYSDPAHGPRRVPVVKSGTDFQYLSELRLRLREDAPLTVGGGDVPSRMEVTLIKHAINGDMPEHPRMAAVVRSHQGVLRGLMAEVLGVVDVPLDTRFQVVRTMESNAGNWLADLMRVGLGADVALLNGGNIRSDAIIDAGAFSKLNLINMLPFPTQVCRVRVPPSALLAALEVGVSGLPAMSGGFLQVSGVRFRYDSQAPPGRRVQITSVEVYLDSGAMVQSKHSPVASGKWEWTPVVSLPAGATVTAAIPDFMADGKEGFDMLKGGNGDTVTEVDGENGPALTALVTNYFTLAKAANGILTQRDPDMRNAISAIKRWAQRAKATMRARRAAGTLKDAAAPPDGERALPKVPSRAALPELRGAQPAPGTASSSVLPQGSSGTAAAPGILRIAPRVDGRISQTVSASAREVHEERDKFFSQGHHGCRAGDVEVMLAAMGGDATSDLRSKLDGSGLRKGVHWDIRSGESRSSIGGAHSDAAAETGAAPDGMLASMAARVKDACASVAALLRPHPTAVSPSAHGGAGGASSGFTDEENTTAHTLSESEWA